VRGDIALIPLVLRVADGRSTSSWALRAFFHDFYFSFASICSLMGFPSFSSLDSSVTQERLLLFLVHFHSHDGVKDYPRF
jgi:hypothetical protein